MTVHIYAYPWQPFTRFDDCGHIFRHKPRSLYRCHECGDRRQARNLEVQAYYDRWFVRCAGGRHPGWS
jgi:hypothetical protein